MPRRFKNPVPRERIDVFIRADLIKTLRVMAAEREDTLTETVEHVLEQGLKVLLEAHRVGSRPS